MKKRILFLLFLGPSAFAGNSISEVAQRCAPLSAAEKPLYSSDFRWGYSLPEMLQAFNLTYRSPKRLPLRAFWDDKAKVLKLPYSKERGGDIEVGESFIKTIARHVERAFELKYVDGVFFPDMGHSHLLVPERLMKEKYDVYSIPQMSLMYQEMFRDKNISILYHTAEQLQTLDQEQNVLSDPRIQWRYRTRNIVGQNHPSTDLQVLQNPESKANTVHGAPGFAWWGAGFNLSAQKSGCFEYRVNGKSYYFDLSMYDLEPDPNAVGVFD